MFTRLFHRSPGPKFDHGEFEEVVDPTVPASPTEAIKSSAPSVEFRDAATQTRESHPGWMLAAIFLAAFLGARLGTISFSW